jgi:hypothetical protein
MNTTRNHLPDARPDILEVIGRYTSLRKVGRDYIGSSPCHNDRHPSLRVNPDKQVWFCDPCAIGGDVIRFIQVADKVSFKEAINILGLNTQPKHRRIVTAAQHRAAAVAASWMVEQRRKVNVLLGEVLEKIELADEIADGALAESFLCEQSFLRDLYEDLQILRYAAELLSIRPTIEAITEGIEL